MVLLCQEVLSQSDPPADSGCEVTMAVREHRLLTTRFTRNPQCRFDHAALPARWSKAGIDDTIRQLLASLGVSTSTAGWRFSVDGCRFARRFDCLTCGRGVDGLRLVRPWAGVPFRCACGARLRAGALDLQSSVAVDAIAACDLDRPLGALGLSPGDLALLSAHDETHVVEVTERSGRQPARGT
jgi:hypothetical protein